MSKETQLRQVLDCGIVAVVRSPDSQQLVEAARALADGGVSVVEITMTVPDALDVVRRVRAALGDRLLLGAGALPRPGTAPAGRLGAGGGRSSGWRGRPPGRPSGCAAATTSG